MASPKLTSSDKRDLEKFTKYLVYKCIQIIVQSRLGERIKTQSRPYSTGSDWFNLAVKDIPEVYAECKKVITTGTLSEGHHVCVEISLKTTEGDSMILETWWLSVKDQPDPVAKVSYTVYNRMGVMLKSLYCTTRATPAYRLSRKQGSDSYVVCYRIYTSEPEMSCLGGGYEMKQVGAVPTPTGTIQLSVAYRTKMLLSPHSSVRGLPEDCKLDHFKLEGSPRRAIDIPKPCFTGNHDNRAPDDGYVFGESEYCATSFSTSPSADFLHHHMTNGNVAASPSHRNMARKASSETLVQRGVNDNFPQKVVSESAIGKHPDNRHDNAGQLTNGVHKKEPAIKSSTTSDDVDLLANIKQIGGFVSDGESDVEDTTDSPLNGPRTSKNNTDSLEIPFVKMVNALSSLDNNANTTGASPPTTKPNGSSHASHTAATDGLLTRDPLGGLKAKRSSGFTQEGLFGVNGCDVVTEGVVVRQKKSLTSELSERLRRASGESSKSSASSQGSGGQAEEYVMIDEKTTLSEMDDNPELGQFYRECKLPPSLAMFSAVAPPVDSPEQQFSMQDMYNSITDQLNTFETQAQDFDDFLNSLSVGETS